MVKISNKTIEKFKAKDHEAFAEIFFSYKDTVFSFALHNFKNEEDANDCVQEIFQKLFMNIDKYDIPRNNFNAWFIQLCKNHIIDMKRKFTKEKRRCRLDNKAINACVDDSYNKSGIFEELEEVLEEDEFEILVLKIIHEVSFTDIGYYFNTSRESVRRKYHIAFKKAKAYLERRKNSD